MYHFCVRHQYCTVPLVCCAALSCIATPMLNYKTLNCIAKISAENVKRDTLNIFEMLQVKTGFVLN